jgi:hypothetical protein
MADAEDAKTEIERDVERGHAAGNRLVNRWTRLLLGWGVEARGPFLSTIVHIMTD